jgi:hypothetical protein
VLIAGSLVVVGKGLWNVRGTRLLFYRIVYWSIPSRRPRTVGDLIKTDPSGAAHELLHAARSEENLNLTRCEAAVALAGLGRRDGLESVTRLRDDVKFEVSDVLARLFRGNPHLDGYSDFTKWWRDKGERAEFDSRVGLWYLP